MWSKVRKNLKKLYNISDDVINDENNSSHSVKHENDLMKNENYFEGPVVETEVVTLSGRVYTIRSDERLSWMSRHVGFYLNPHKNAVKTQDNSQNSIKSESKCEAIKSVVHLNQKPKQINKWHKKSFKRNTNRTQTNWENRKNYSFTDRSKPLRQCMRKQTVRSVQSNVTNRGNIIETNPKQESERISDLKSETNTEKEFNIRFECSFHLRRIQVLEQNTVVFSDHKTHPMIRITIENKYEEVIMVDSKQKILDNLSEDKPKFKPKTYFKTIKSGFISTKALLERVFVVNGFDIENTH